MAPFTEKELQFLHDKEFLLTKHAIHQKVTAILRETDDRILRNHKQKDLTLPSGAFAKSGKISRGENYRGLPYWVLDAPRKFRKEETFAFRTMVWWGHLISCTLHVSGPSWQKVDRSLLPDEFYFCIADNPWEYHFQSDNYLPIRKLSEAEIHQHIHEYGFIKLARQWPLRDLQILPELAVPCFEQALASLSQNQ